MGYLERFEFQRTIYVQGRQQTIAKVTRWVTLHGGLGGENDPQ